MDDYWLGLRLQQIDISAIHLTKQNESNASAAPELSDACDLYLRLKGIGKDKVFKRTAKRNTAYVIEVLGDRPLDAYPSSDAATFRDWLIGKGMKIKTVKRVFSSVRAIINLSIAEELLNCSNPFAKTYFPDDKNTQSKEPISIDDIVKLQSLCRENDDEMRWMIVLISDTGMRLGEAVGLLKEDIKIDEPFPHVDLNRILGEGLRLKGVEG